MIRRPYKLAAAAMGFSVLLAVGTTYAQSDEALFLQNWYKARSQQITQLLDSTAKQEVGAASQQLTASRSDAEDQAEATLLEAWETGTQEAAKITVSTSLAYSNQMEQKVTELKESSHYQVFDPYIRAANNQTDAELDQLVEDILKELTDQLNSREVVTDSH